MMRVVTNFWILAGLGMLLTGFLPATFARDRMVVGYVDRYAVLNNFPGIVEIARRVRAACEISDNQDNRVYYDGAVTPGKIKPTQNRLLSGGRNRKPYWDSDLTLIVQTISTAEERVAQKNNLDLMFNYGRPFDLLAKLMEIAVQGEVDLAKKVDFGERKFHYFDSPLGLGGREVTGLVIEELLSKKDAPAGGEDR